MVTYPSNSLPKFSHFYLKTFPVYFPVDKEDWPSRGRDIVSHLLSEVVNFAANFLKAICSKTGNNECAGAPLQYS